MRKRPSLDPWIRCAAALRLLRSSALAFDRSQSLGRAPVAVLADQPVDLGVFAELLQPRGEHDQFAAVGHHHARAIDRLVAEPGALEFVRIEIHHDLLQGLVEQVEVHLLRQARAERERLHVVADIQAAHDHPAAGLVLLHHRQHERGSGRSRRNCSTA